MPLKGRHHPLAPPRRPANVPLAPALRGTAAAATEDTPGQRDEMTSRLEAILWLADEPLSLKRLATLMDLEDPAPVQRAIHQLRELHHAEGAAFQIEELAGGFQMLTRAPFYPWLARVRKPSEDTKLSPVLMETLAVVAYRQPLTRADLESIRGVRCDDALKALTERKLIQITGRHDSLGRPALYGTTKKFLQSFGLRDLSELPAVEGK
jgi:segregation and condensation protein B